MDVLDYNRLVFLIYAKASDSQMFQPWTFSKEKTKTTTKSYHQWKYEEYLYYFLLWQNKNIWFLQKLHLTGRSQPSAKGLMSLESST